MLNKIALKIRNTFPETYQRFLNYKQGRYNYTFKKENYPHSFLANSYENDYTGKPAPEIIYCFWTGDNPLTENRQKGLKALEENAGIPVKLITPKNLAEYIKPGFPLHKGYELLSLVHRSDYLRCYFMHHHGGGYADIKPFSHSWKPAFAKLNSDKGKYMIGYPELLHGGLSPVTHRFLVDKSIYKDYDKILDSEEKIFRDLTKHTPLVLGNCSFICKPNTPITKEWYEELHKRMDTAYEILKKFDETGENTHTSYRMDYPEDEGYPIPYFHLLGQILHPIQLKYHRHILQYKKLLPELKNYR